MNNIVELEMLRNENEKSKKLKRMQNNNLHQKYNKTYIKNINQQQTNF